MKIKKIVSGILLSATLLMSEGATAQILTQVTSDNYSTLGVVSDAVGCWVLDCSAIDPDRLATTSITGSGDLYSHNESATTNRVWRKLLIAAADYTSGYTWSELTTSGSHIDALSQYGYSDWRLPTQRELMLIWIMMQNDSTFSASFTSIIFWSATTYSSNSSYAWSVSFSSGIVFYNGNTYTGGSVCPVKEL